ncbi:c-type cytochrome [Moraxella haemolytica]|uniref:c-type cytochrome n=1 Tax=Moraxella TaxID=475 RepID=UPI002542D2BE|nr:c-type cytochrome [Moraxella sp. ZY171148]WII95744.1 c-type cytochrome [Moraxella sp. ZY171148]
MSKLLQTIVTSLALSVASITHADVASIYKDTCATCHDSGALNAPKKGDKATWDRLKTQKGVDTLIKNTRQGMPRMPAMGLCQTCSNDDFARLIEYMEK